MAFLDDNVFVQYAEITQDIYSQTVNIPIKLLNSISQIPNAAFFLNGITLKLTPLQHDTAYRFAINSVSKVAIDLQVTITPGYKISWFSYTVIYGQPQYLITGEQSFNNVGLVALFTADGRTKYSKVGLISLEAVNNTRITVQNLNGNVLTKQFGDTVVSYLRLSYFQYLPCPLYCTSCYATIPNCDACLASTQRSGTTCTTCPSQTFSASDQMNCQQCRSYCNNCVTNASNCIACQSDTLRSGVPSCSTCPPGMFLEILIDNCQSCKSYCNGCSGSPNGCILCDSSSLRINPPDCLTCPPQQHIISNNPICQPCLSYCNSCLPNNSQCVACSSLSFRLNPPDCQECPQFMYLSEDTCIQCDNFCGTCDQYGCLTCLSQSSYINSLNQCADCPVHCLSCDINKCNSCAGNCSQCDFYGCQKCIQDNYYIQGTDCIQCPLNCQTCNQSTCLTCIGPRTVIDNICQCQYPCLTCNSTECQTCISRDYRVYQGNCQYCPSRCITCDQSGECQSSPLNCQIGIMLGIQAICKQCQQYYYLNDNICNKCSSVCLECINQQSNCTVCRFTQLDSQQCLLCEQNAGYYSNFQNNICYTSCGDGILAGNEQCDDGNQISQDGCTNCQIDDGYQCSGIICQQIVYPLPTLEQDLTLDSPYNSTKLFLLTYNVPIQAIDLDILLSIIPSTKFNYQIQQMDNQNFNLQINLQQQSLNGILQLTFISATQIQTLEGIKQQQLSVKSDISTFLTIGNTEQNIGHASNKIMNILLIILVVLIFIAVLFGGLEVLWNLLDLLQTISYLKYINIVKPLYLFEFFDLFQFLQLQNLPLNQILNTQVIIQDFIDVNQFNPSPLLISKDGYSTSTLINICPIINVVLTGIFCYYFAKYVLRLTVRVNIARLVRCITRIRVSIFIYDLNSSIITICFRIQKQWIWSGIIRMFITSAYEICFMICLGFYGLQISKLTISLIIDLYLTFISFFTLFIMTYVVCKIASFQKKSLMLKENEFGAVFESLRFTIFAKYYNAILIQKKFLFMISLILLYNEPIFQILGILLVQASQIIFLLVAIPIQELLERYKQILCEILVFFTEIQLGILVIDDYLNIIEQDSRNIYGWICLFSIVHIIIIQLCMDSFQQYKRMYKKYPFVRKIVNRICCKSFLQNSTNFEIQ